MRHKNKFLAWVMAGVIIMGLTGCDTAKENEIIPQDNSGYENSESETEAKSDTDPAVVTTETADITTTVATITEQTTATTTVIEEISTTTEIPVTEETAVATKLEEISTETSEISETQNTPIQENEDEKYLVKTEFGDYVDLRDAYKFDFFTSGGGDGRDEMTLDEALEQESVHYLAYFNGFSYATKSRGKSYNSIDNVFDDEENKFITNDEYLEHEYNYFKVFEGDKFESLTVREASVAFEGDYKEGEKTDVIAYGLSITFSGDLTINGYIMTEQLDSLFYPGSITFLADADTWGDIPILEDRGNRYSKAVYSVNNIKFSTDINAFIFEEPDKYIDITAIPQDGSYAHVTLKISELDLNRFDTGDGGYNHGKIESVTLLEG